MSRKIASSPTAKSRSRRKTAKRRKSPLAKNPARNRKKRAESALAIVPPLPGQGKRGEQGYLAYLLRQAQAATRLTMERALSEIGVTPPQFVVLTMLRAYPGLSGAELARVAASLSATSNAIVPFAKLRIPCTAGCCNGPSPAAARPCWPNAGATPGRWNGGSRPAFPRRRRPRYGTGCPKSPQICRNRA
jgi:hypothetical protein